jgi:hypothetical protein
MVLVMPYPQLSEKDRCTLMATGKCFCCQQFGHIACNCPQNHKPDDKDDSRPEVFTIAVNSIGIGNNEPIINKVEDALFQPSITNLGGLL